MMQALEEFLAANAGHDPSFQVLADLVALMPWWYPYMWLAVIGLYASYRLARWSHGRLQVRRGIRRMQDRLALANSAAFQDARALRLHRMSANDNFVLAKESENNAG